MKKTLIVLMMIVAMTVAFSGCAEKSAEKEVSVETENLTREQEPTAEIAEPEEIAEEEASEENKEASEEKAEAEKVEEPEETQTPEEKAPVEEPVKISLSGICSEIKTTVSASGAMDLEADAIANLYGISSADIAQAAGFVVMEGTFPHEAVMVEAKDAGAASRIEALLKAKHAAFTEQSKGYDAANYELASKCKVERKGNHVSMFLTPDFEAMRSVYSKYVK